MKKNGSVIKKLLSFALALVMVIGIAAGPLAKVVPSSLAKADKAQKVTEPVRANYLESGILSNPKYTQGQIKTLLNQTSTAMPGNVFVTQPTYGPYTTGQLHQDVLNRTLDRLNALRRIAGLGTVVLDSALNESAQHGAVLLAASNFSHTPNKPSNMSQDFYDRGYDATTQSNLASGSYLTLTPDLFMNDTDSSNISGLGHRRWQLSPSLGKVGIGYAVKSSKLMTCQRVFDNSASVGDYNFIAWPASGNFPNNTDAFKNNSAWSVTLNPNKYSVPAKSDLTITVNGGGKTWTLKGTTNYSTTSGNYLNVSTSGYSYIWNCIIFRLENVSSYNGEYTVNISGIKNKSGQDVEFSYRVNFFNPANVNEEPINPAPTPTPAPTPVPTAVPTPGQDGLIQLGVSNVFVANAQASNGETADKAIDGDINTIWHTKWGYTSPLSERYITLELNAPAYVSKYEYQPRTNASNGRVNEYKIYVSMDGQNWTEVASGSWANNGELKTVEFTPVQAKFVKLEGVTTHGNTSGEVNRYMSAAEIRVFGSLSAAVETQLGIANVFVGSEEAEKGDGKENAIDGNNNTLWHTKWGYAASLEERYITLELTSVSSVSRYEYQPRVTGNNNGRVKQYRISVSMDGQSWTTVSTGNWADNGDLKSVEFAPVQAKFVKLEGVETYGSVSSQNNKFMSAAEIRVFGTASAIQQEYINFSVLNKWTSMDNNAEWGNGQDKYIPRTISYQLMANGQPYGQVQSFTNPFGGNKTWDDQASWSNVPKYDANGNEITYTLKVVSDDERWLLTDNTLNNISGNNYRFELCHRWAMARINVSLAWQGGNGESIGAPAGALLKVNLMKRTENGQGQQIATLYLDSSNSFSGTFKTTSYTNDGAEDAFLPRVFQKDANGNVVFQNDKPVLDSNAYYLVEEWLNPTYWEAVYPSSILSDSNYSGYSNGEFNVRIINRAVFNSMSAPTGVKAELGSDNRSGAQPVISWNSVEPAMEYEIYRAPKGGTYSLIGTSTETRYVDEELSVSGTYYYKVKATNGDIGSPFSTYASIKFTEGQLNLTAPTGISVTVVNGVPHVTWNEVRGAEEYEVYRAPKGGSYSLIATVTETSFDDSSLNSSGTFYYRVRAISGSVQSPYSSQVYIKYTVQQTSLTAPTGITAGLANGQPRISWNTVNGAASYEVYRAKKGGSYSLVGTVTTNSFDDVNLNTSGTYYYKVRAISGSVVSGYSSQVSIKYTANSAPTTLTAPTGLKLTIVNGKPHAAWNAVNGAASYEVYRAKKGGSYSLVGTVTGTSFDDVSLNVSGTYYYKVRAVNGSVVSGYSSQVYIRFTAAN